MRLNDIVHIPAGAKAAYAGCAYCPGAEPAECGRVEYISPHGWVTLMLRTGGGKELYRESFWEQEVK